MSQKWRTEQLSAIHRPPTTLSLFVKNYHPPQFAQGVKYQTVPGPTYFYAYLDLTLAQALQVNQNLQRVGVPLFDGLTGGRLYNAIVRPSIFRKASTI